METCPNAFPAFDANLPVVGIHHILDDLRAQSRASGFTTDGARGEQAFSDFRRHASARIRHRQIEEVILGIRFRTNCDDA